ncbi:unnamed protein product (macronuclear) [Paramecium tetraurelia]|uniref:Uncharacterized protein n=1 Tax=Paramecium tetraurelia TaxID=5888 RepID=A0CDY3_PARTE|nr:uncharacterized protein GSPATT00007212001 [Paramecium tetraurelia]CAK69000.1 unnamed protein product [Paramecium tetraurelia]|eukprot:XP_001436397.1 hypothetical protein (macronuclear) [Paramecium tetraurelia strain d4-2]
MGGVQSLNRNCKKSLLSCLQLLVEDVEFYADAQFLAQIKNIQISFPNNFEKNRKKKIDLLKQSLPPQISFHEDVLLNYLSSAFQCSLIRSNNSKLKNSKDISMDKEFVKTFRLMNFSGLQQEYDNCYQNNLVHLYQGLNCYCNLANQIIKELNQNLDVQCKVYVLIWEHFQNHLCKLSTSDAYDLQPLNQYFNENYAIISPNLKIEAIGGKLWGTLVQQLNLDYIRQQFQIARRDPTQQSICLFQVFNALIDMNIDAANLQWIGISDFKFTGSLKLLIDFIVADTNQFLNQLNEKSQGNLFLLLDLWEKDDNFLKSVLPTWICENILNTQFFSFFEQRIREKIKLMQTSQQKNLIVKHSKQKVDTDFQSQLEQAKMSLDSIFFQVDFFQQQNIDSTLQIMIKQLRSENEFSSIILASENTQQGPSDLLVQQTSHIFSDLEVHHIQSNILEQQDSDIFGSQALDSKLLSPEDEIAEICQKYDQKKNSIYLNIQQRDEKIKLRNRNLQPISNELSKIFSFVHSISKEQVDVLVNLLIEQKHKEVNQMNNLFVNQENFKGSIAAELLFLMQK